MKKIYAFLMSAVALVGFAACSEGLNEITVNGNENTTEVTLFAEFEDDTRMTLNGNTPEWEKGDVIYINGVEFTAQEAGSAVQFKGTVTEDLIGQAYTAYFGTKDGKVAAEQTAVAGHMSKETPATAEIAAFESGMTISFKNAAALLQFTPSFSGDVTFAVVGGETVTLKGCEADKTYYVAVTPATWTNGVEVTSNDIFCKEGAKGQVIDRNKIYPLGSLNLVYRVYVEDDSKFTGDLNMYLYNSDGDNTWPGQKYDGTKTINGVTYKYFNIDSSLYGKTYTYIFNNNSSQVEEEKSFTFNGNNYVWLSHRYTKTIDNVNTHNGYEYQVSLFIKNERGWGNLGAYLWNDNGNIAEWPGVHIDMSLKTKINDAWHHYYELGTNTWKYVIINEPVNGWQTGNLTVPSIGKDIFTSNNDSGYIWE